QTREHLLHNRNGILGVQLLFFDKRSQTSPRDILHDQIRRVRVWIETTGVNNIAVIQPMNRRSFALEVADVLPVGRDLDGHHLIGPHVVTRAPDLAERATTHKLFQNVLADSLIGRRHVYSLTAWWAVPTLHPSEF